jgi:HK97 family phage prohead protease
MDIINKALTSPVEQVVGTTDPTYRFVISTDDPDRDEDIVKQDGWQLDEFMANPICLLQHDHKQPIGRWSNIQTRAREKGGYETIADLTLAPPVSDVLKYANALVSAGILNATSVGFGVKSFEKRKDAQGRPRKGMVVHKAVLREVSLVSVPANANAIRIAKSLDISNDVVKTFVSVDGVDSDIDVDDDTPLPLSVALEKAQTLLTAGHKSSKPHNPNSVFGQVKIKDEQLLNAYQKAKSLLKK